MSDVDSNDVVTAEDVQEVILDEQKNEKVVEAAAEAEVAVVAEADDGTTEPEEAENKEEETNGTSEEKEAEHKNGDATPKANGDTNGTNKDADDVELKRKGGDEAPEPVVEGISPEKKLKLVEADNSEKEEPAVEANGEATEVSS